MSEQIEQGVKKGRNIKNEILTVTTLFFWISIEEPLIKSLFDVLTTQIFIFIFFVKAGVLFRK